MLKEKEKEIINTFYDLRMLTDFVVEYRYDLIFDEESINREDILNKVDSFYKIIFEKVKNSE